jgi:molybdenum cofactor biosynthesis protein B
MAGPHEVEAVHVRGGSVRCVILTISDTRTLQTDDSGRLIATLLNDAGFPVAERNLVRDEPTEIAAALEKWVSQVAPGVEVILTTGGTGISRRDTTIEVVRKLLTSELEGFGELFRVISYGQVKSAAMLSRAVGGLVARPADQGGDTFIFAMPGSVNAVQTAMTALIIPELKHLAWERRR